MGVYFDFFRAVDDEAARATAALPAGPLAAAPGEQPGFDGLPTKSVFPRPHVEQLVALAAGVPYQLRSDTSEGLWPPPDTPPPVDETSLWLTDPSVERLATRVRDALAGIEPTRAQELAAGWLPELGTGFDVEQVVELVTGLSGLARRARDAGEELYCWSSL